MIVLPARPARDQRLDVIRGGLQIAIFVSHIANSFVGGWFIHRAWGLSDSSEQFLFLSGFMLGSVYTLKAARDSARAAASDIFRRAGRLYCTHLTLCLGFFGMLALVSARFIPGELSRLGWGWLIADPLHALPAILGMIYEPDWMDILPTFVWGMLLLPPFLFAVGRIGSWALLPPALVYLAVQIGWITSPSLTEEIGMGFDPFAWQMLYLLGAWLGRRALLYGRALPYDAPWAPLATAAAVLALVVGFYVKLSWHGFLPLPAPAVEAAWVYDKQEFAWPRLLHAMSLAWLVGAFMPRDAGWMRTGLAEAVARMGRHSLEVFCLGVFLSYFVSTALRLWPGYFWVLDFGLSAVGIAILMGWARILAGKRAPKPLAIAA